MKYLKDYFSGLKIHKKIIFLLSIILGSVSFVFVILQIYFTFAFDLDGAGFTFSNLFELLTGLITTNYFAIFELLFFIIQVIFILLRKFNYFISVANIVLFFCDLKYKIAMIIVFCSPILGMVMC